MKRGVVFVGVLIAIGVYFLFGKQDVWVGFYYPNENDLAGYSQSVEMGSLEECRDWVDGQASIYNPSGLGYDYECGKNCKYDERWGGYTCEETLR